MDGKSKIQTLPLPEVKDTEYNALRRRMSRLRVQQGQLPIADDMDLEAGDEYYNDLMRFWKKHKIYMGKDMLSTINEAKAKKKARQRGRRKSIEFEDLDMNSSGTLSLPESLSRRSRFDSENDTVPEDSEWAEPPEAEKVVTAHDHSKDDVVKKRQTSATSMRSQTRARTLSQTESPKLRHKGSNSPKSSSPKSGSPKASPKILRKTMSEGAIKSKTKTAKTVIENKDKDATKTVK